MWAKVMLSPVLAFFGLCGLFGFFNALATIKHEPNGSPVDTYLILHLLLAFAIVPAAALLVSVVKGIRSVK